MINHTWFRRFELKKRTASVFIANFLFSLIVFLLNVGLIVLELISALMTLFVVQVLICSFSILRSQTLMLQHLYLKVLRDFSLWNRSHFQAFLVLHRDQRELWWVDQWLLPSRGTFWIPLSSIQLFIPTYFLMTWKINFKLLLYFIYE